MKKIHQKTKNNIFVLLTILFSPILILFGCNTKHIQNTNFVFPSNPYEHCFRNSTWVVPPETLLAYLYENATTIPVDDQTVWVISNYNQGYFSGQSYTAIDNSLLSQRYLIGTVTSEGDVNITFYSDSSGDAELVSGFGNLNSQCVFTMQMNSGQDGVNGLVHWSYMIPVSPGDFFYEHLPGTNMNVPQFIEQF